MKRLALILLLLSFTLAPYAQKRTGKSAQKKTAVTQKSGKTNKSSKTSKTSKTKNTGKSGKGGKGKSNVTTPAVQALQNERQQIQKKIQEQEKLLSSNQKDVRKRLQDLMVINTEIEGKRRTIDTIRHDISNLDIEIERLGAQLDLLQAQLNERKKNYVKSMRYMHRNRSSQSQLMFIFSADNLVQMFRRLRFMREYASYQRAQGEEVKVQQEVNRNDARWKASRLNSRMW